MPDSQSSILFTSPVHPRALPLVPSTSTGKCKSCRSRQPFPHMLMRKSGGSDTDASILRVRNSHCTCLGGGTRELIPSNTKEPTTRSTHNPSLPPILIDLFCWFTWGKLKRLQVPLAPPLSLLNSYLPDHSKAEIMKQPLVLSAASLLAQASKSGLWEPFLLVTTSSILKAGSLN